MKLLYCQLMKFEVLRVGPCLLGYDAVLIGVSFLERLAVYFLR